MMELFFWRWLGLPFGIIKLSKECDEQSTREGIGRNVFLKK